MQGFATGDLEGDAAAIRLFANAGLELLLSQSYAKNMVGSLCVPLSLFPQPCSLSASLCSCHTYVITTARSVLLWHFRKLQSPSFRCFGSALEVNCRHLTIWALSLLFKARKKLRANAGIGRKRVERSRTEELCKEEGFRVLNLSP